MVLLPTPVASSQFQDIFAYYSEAISSSVTVLSSKSFSPVVEPKLLKFNTQTWPLPSCVFCPSSFIEQSKHHIYSSEGVDRKEADKQGIQRIAGLKHEDFFKCSSDLKLMSCHTNYLLSVSSVLGTLPGVFISQLNFRTTLSPCCRGKTRVGWQMTSRVIQLGRLWPVPPTGWPLDGLWVL